MKDFFQMLKGLERAALTFPEYTGNIPYKLNKNPGKQQLRKCRLLVPYQIAPHPTSTYAFSLS